jgi:hypothetical protein
MKNFKPVILAAVIGAIAISIIGFWVFEGGWQFFPYLLLAGLLMVFVQKETVAYRFLLKLFLGSLIFAVLAMLFVSFRMYLTFIRFDSDFTFFYLIDWDRWAMAAVFFLVSILGGLLGIVFKGFYQLYKSKLDWVIIFGGPIILTLASLAILKAKIGGTILSGLYGWPYPFLIHQVKDVLDNFQIDKWIFSPGSLYHYVIFDYLVYLLFFIAIYYLLKLLKKISGERIKINMTICLFAVLVLVAVGFTSFLSFKQTYISYEIANSGECQEDLDCVVIGQKCPFGCSIIANTSNAERIKKLVYSFPSTCSLDCFWQEKASCEGGKCQVAPAEAPVGSGIDAWEEIKKEVASCNVKSVMQTHDLDVVVTLRFGGSIKAKEPVIDEIFDVVKQAEGKCGRIRMATE